MDDLDLLLELTFGIAAVEPCFQPQLVQHPLIKPPRSQLGIGKIQDDIFFPRKFRIKPADQRGFSTAGICCYDRKHLPVCYIAEPAERFPECIRLIEFLSWDITDKGCMLHSKEGFIHDHPPPSDRKQRRLHRPSGGSIPNVSFPAHQGSARLSESVPASQQEVLGSYHRTRQS